MNRVAFRILVGCLLPLTATGAPWSFDAALAVTTPPAQAPVFHHLDSSGRRNIAAAGGAVAVAWEDDRDGTPRIYLAHRNYEDSRFTPALQVSGAKEAFEPSILALGGKRFAIAWEEDEQVWLRLVQVGDKPVPGPMQEISPGNGAQASLVGDGDQILVLWSEREGRFGRIRALRLGVDGLNVVKKNGCPIDTVPPIDEQLYPTGAVLQGRLAVAWEDRRPKHTIIMAAIEDEPKSCRFSAPVRISEKPPGRNLPYGAGHGVSRVALSRVTDGRLFAAWADKRDFRQGYDVWGAFYQIDGPEFEQNQMVQDDFGGFSKQHHAAVAGNESGLLVVAWDDEREGNADVMLSWQENGGWSDDWPLPGASGPGLQGNPTITLDSEGNLHVAWVERDEPDGATRLKYSFGRADEE
jgi:hypothetical protein